MMQVVVVVRGSQQSRVDKQTGGNCVRFEYVAPGRRRETNYYSANDTDLVLVIGEHTRRFNFFWRKLKRRQTSRLWARQFAPTPIKAFAQFFFFYLILSLIKLWILARRLT